ncbi:hypothetical protein O3M35_002194 [Rhynocoris fuscipes]|uniref:SH3 domain-containing protein n=1 Tax=Rhynocoris fuscipes TaxID=488301 RepID=A0AAW1CST4_9HEMI
MRMSSVELPDDNEKSVSSASTSPCPSPKPHRLLPTNLYVVLYNFKSRHADELDLKAGYKLTVIDTSDPDWWRGKCLGRVGYFPSKYVAKVQPGERALQVTHNLQVADCTLLRDQIVIQIGEEVDGMVMIRCGDNRQGVCPVKYLTEQQQHQQQTALTKTDILASSRNFRISIPSSFRPLGMPTPTPMIVGGCAGRVVRRPRSMRNFTSLSRPLLIG